MPRKKNQSEILKILYGNNYDKVIVTDCFSFTDDSPEMRNWNLLIRISALILLIFVSLMAIACFGPSVMIVYFTNWGIIATMTMTMSLIWF